MTIARLLSMYRDFLKDIKTNKQKTISNETIKAGRAVRTRIGKKCNSTCRSTRRKLHAQFTGITIKCNTEA